MALQEIGDALAREGAGARLIVPTATLARHLQYELARGGLLLRRGWVTTLARFVEPWVEDAPQPSAALLHLIAARAARRVTRAARFEGFCAQLVRRIEELSAAGCDAARLERFPAAGAFFDIYREVERDLERRGLALRARRLELAAGRIARQGTGGIRAVWLEGFYVTPEPEAAVIEALGRHAEVKLVAPDAQRQAGTPAPPPPSTELFEAPTMEREADEIARRILEKHALGRPFREMAVVLRSPEPYLPLLEATLERFGLPARFYFEAPLARQGVARYLAGIVEALLEGWDHEQTMAALRLAPWAGATGAMDRFDFEVRRRLPARGLAGLVEMTRGREPMAGLLGELERLAPWATLELPAEEWAARLQTLRALVRPPRPGESVTRAEVEAWRSQAAALRGFEEATTDAARFLEGSQPMPLQEFWKSAKTALERTPLAIDDRRREVVHVMSAHEARQWSLPVVFVCGLVEGQFPRREPPDIFFPEAARRELAGASIRVRTAAAAEAEERLLFEAAVTRATEASILSFATTDARGERNLPSIYLAEGNLAPAATGPVRPEPLAVRAPPPALRIESPDLVELVRAQNACLRPTALESYLQCPFRFFARHTLALEEPPPKPSERLDARLQGKIVHAVIAEWLRQPQAMEPLFRRVFEQGCREALAPPGYRVQALAAQMLEDLERFARDRQWSGGAEVEVEKELRIELAENFEVSGRLDRLDRFEGSRVYVIDYKYSKRPQDYARDRTLLQGQLYLLAAEKQEGLAPAGMFYCGLRDRVTYAGWSDGAAGPPAAALERAWLSEALERAIAGAARIRAGVIAPQPDSPERCRTCAYPDVCRWEAAECG